MLCYRGPPAVPRGLQGVPQPSPEASKVPPASPKRQNSSVCVKRFWSTFWKLFEGKNVHFSWDIPQKLASNSNAVSTPFFKFFLKNVHLAWDIPQKLTFRKREIFFLTLLKKHENRALACMPGPKLNFQLFEKTCFFHLPKC